MTTVSARPAQKSCAVAGHALAIANAAIKPAAARASRILAVIYRRSEFLASQLRATYPMASQEDQASQPQLNQYIVVSQRATSKLPQDRLQLRKHVDALDRSYPAV